MSTPTTPHSSPQQRVFYKTKRKTIELPQSAPQQHCMNETLNNPYDQRVFYTPKPKPIELVQPVPQQHRITSIVRDDTLKKLCSLWSDKYKQRFNALKQNNPHATVTEIVNYMFYKDTLDAQQHKYCGYEDCKWKMCPYMRSLECCI